MMQDFRRICVYCGSNSGSHIDYATAAKKLGEHLAKEGLCLVYGGGNVGLMGVLANAALAAGGEVIGVIPKKLEALEVGHKQLSELYVVDDMHSRKAKMAELSDAFIALPGGFGTLEELFEVTTWSQLNYHLKPIGLLNVRSYYDELLRFIRHAIEEGFVRDVHAELIQSASSPKALLAALTKVEIPRIEEWIEPA